MHDQLHYQRAVEVRYSVDVLVAGGGPAGMAAAVTAARQGQRVLLVEGQNCLGGMGTAGMLPVFMPFGDAVHFYADGFGREVHDQVVDGAGGESPFYWGSCLLIRQEALKRLYDTLALAAGVGLSLVTQVIDVRMDGDAVSHVICAAKSGIFAVEARMVIDCTGDGDLAAWAGAPFEKGSPAGALMPGTLCSLWAQVDWERAHASGQSTEAVLLQVLREHPTFFTVPDPHLPGMLPIGHGIAGGNVGHMFGLDGADERSITRALLHARATLPEYEAFYRQFITGFEAAELVATAPLVGVRESRRILGDYVLCEADYEQRAVFDDEIGRYNYWIDRHCDDNSPEAFQQHLHLRQHPYQPGESYGIPYRTLTPRGLRNLLVAGRCVSTDRAVQASLRVMPGCFITGQAAGMAATLALETGTDTRGIDIAILQHRLRALGAFLPNAVGV